jgi:hypothetical protein
VNPIFEFLKAVIFQTTRFVSPPPVATEWVITAMGALVVAAVPLGHRFGRLRKAFHALANRRRTAIAISGLVPVVIRLSMLGFVPVPEPSIHDEFSHLLLGDTLAHERLANPTHPMWQHFESIHILQQPTYSSMYPPAQGIFLAAGEVLFHEPWAGVVISVGLMCMAVCWMLQQWLPPAWALFGALLAGIKIGIVGLWIDSYMGGAVAAIGGALLIGSVAGPFHRSKSLFLGLGMVILMNSRPFDGALLSLVALLYLATRIKVPELVKRLVPAAAILACGVVFTGYYNYRVTGHATRMGYQVNRDTYGWPENLAFLSPKKMSLRDPVMQRMYLKEVSRREVYHQPSKLADDLVTRLFDNWTYFIGPVLTFPLLFLPWIFRDRRTRPLVYFIGAVVVLNLFQLVLYPYHLAPLVGAIFAVVVQGTRHLYVRLGHARGAMLALALPACVLAVDGLKQNAGDLNLQLAYWERAAEWHRDARAYIVQWLSNRPGKHLVIVHYSPTHEVNQEWVYNGADIDGSKIVWAREVSPESDQKLLKYFHDRQAWLLKADEYPQRVVRYPSAGEKLPDMTRTSDLLPVGSDDSRKR